jgi:hypothetical protein
MGSRLSSPRSVSKVVPVVAGPSDQAASLLVARINAMRLILRNQPYAGDFMYFVEMARKSRLLFYFHELENVKKSLRHLNTSIIPNTRVVISQNHEIHRLFYTVDHTLSSKAQMNVETIAIECLQPLLLHEPHTDVTVPIFVRMIRMCQNNLLYHLIPEMKEYLHSDAFHALRKSDVFVIRQVYHQILNHFLPAHPSTTASPTPISSTPSSPHNATTPTGSKHHRQHSCSRTEHSSRTMRTSFDHTNNHYQHSSSSATAEQPSQQASGLLGRYPTIRLSSISCDSYSNLL